MTLKKGLTIDPGHQGIGLDPGAVNAKEGLYESEINLAISLYQAERFKALGVPVALTRSGAKKMTNTERTNLVKSLGYADCISNHINAGGGDGAEVIHSVNANPAFAEAIMDGLVEGGQNERRVFSRKLSNESKHDYYYMHRNTGNVTTLIVEYGFIDSTKDDVIQIKRDWKELAEGVVKAYCNYRGYKYVPPGGDKVTKVEKAVSQFQADIDWAIKNNISNGANPKDPITREQTIAMLHRVYKLLKG